MKKARKEDMETQENAKKKAFYSYRGAGACMAASISFLTDHWWRNLKLSWPVTLFMSLLLAGCTYAGCRWGSELTDKKAVWGVTLFALSISYALFRAFVYVLVHESSHGHSVENLSWREVYGRRFIKYSCRTYWAHLIQVIWATGSCTAAAWILTSTIWGATLPTPVKLGLLVITALVSVTVIVPLRQAEPHAILMGGQPLLNFWTGFKRGWKAWGKVFSLELLTQLLITVLAVLLMMPAMVFGVIQANISASLAAGDSVNLPGWFGCIQGVILLVSSILFTIVSWLEILPGAYLYASLKVDADEEASQKLPII